MTDSELRQLEDKKFLANSKDRAKNTAEISKKIEELKPLKEVSISNLPEMPKFPEQVEVKLTGVEVITLKGDKGEQGDIGPKGDKGEQGIQGKQGLKGAKGDKGLTGEKGKDGKNGKDGEKGKDGENGSPDTAKQILEKLSTLEKAWLDVKAIKGLDELMRGFGEGFLEQAKAFVPRSLDSLYDVAVRGKITNGQSLIYDSPSQKWIPGSASVGGQTPLTVTGTVNGSNQTFTTTSKPSVVYVDGIALQEKDNNSVVQWSYSGGTLTLSVPPPINAIFAYA